MVETTERKQFVDFLRDNGHRVTQERLTLFDEIFTLHGHIDAEELLESMVERGQKISRATVYRNLDLLVECGLVLKHRLGRGRYVFEHVHTGQRHDHLVCSDCGRVAEFVSPGIAALQQEICRAHGFVPGRHSLQITGLCRDCSGRQDDERPDEPAAWRTADA